MCSGLIFNPQVTVISLRSLGSTRRAYVAKTISKSNAVKFEGVNANEIHIYVIVIIVDSISPANIGPLRASYLDGGSKSQAQ